MEDASQAWHSLIDQNPESYDYYRGLLSVKGIDLDALTENTRLQAIRIFTDVSSRIPRAATPRWLTLKISRGG